MNENSKFLPAALVVGSFALAFLIIGIFIGYNWQRPEEPMDPMGSVSITHEYQATTTVLITGTTYKSAQTRHLVASSTAGITLGSVVIASTTDETLAIYNATSSAAVEDGNLATLITTFGANAPQGTYTFDIWLDEGLVLDMAARFGGDYVISYRR